MIRALWLLSLRSPALPFLRSLGSAAFSAKRADCERYRQMTPDAIAAGIALGFWLVALSVLAPRLRGR